MLSETSITNIVVSGPGYSGVGPGDDPATASTAWGYATGPVDVYLGPVRQVDPYQSIDKDLNDVTVYSERPFAAVFDPCCYLAGEANLTREPFCS